MLCYSETVIPDAALANEAASATELGTDFQEGGQSSLGHSYRLRPPLHLHQKRLNPVMVPLLGDRSRYRSPFN